MSFLKIEIMRIVMASGVFNFNPINNYFPNICNALHLKYRNLKTTFLNIEMSLSVNLSYVRWHYTVKVRRKGNGESHACESDACESDACDSHACESHPCDSHAYESHSCESYAYESHAYESRACESNAYESHACERYAYESHACESHACRSHSFKSHACESHACESDLVGVTLVIMKLVKVILVRVVGLYQAKHMVTNGPNITVLKSSSIRKCFNEEAQTKFEHCSGWYRPFWVSKFI